MCLSFLWVSRNDLPGDAVFVFQPAALLRVLVPAFGKLAPIVIDLFLGLAIDLKRNRLVEFEHRPAIERGKRLAVDLRTKDNRKPTTPESEQTEAGRQRLSSTPSRSPDDLTSVSINTLQPASTNAVRNGGIKNIVRGRDPVL